MTLEQWLDEAFQVFPARVQHVLREEYRDHYQDHLDADGTPDALALFGSPADAQKKLKKLYLTQDMLERSGRFATVFAGLVVAGNVLWLTQALSSLNHLDALVTVATLLAIAVLWAATQRLVAARRNALRNLYLTLLLMISALFLSFTFTSSMAFRWSMSISLLCWVYQAFDTDRRIRRTLNPHQSQHARSS